MKTADKSFDRGKFPDTRWSLIKEAGDSAEKARLDALSTICSTYWYPIYAFLRRTGSSPEDAADLTQDIFLALSSQDFIRNADQKKGKLRTYMIAVAKNFRAMDLRKKAAIKRGGGELLLSIDKLWAEGQLEQSDESLSPDAAYDRDWAMKLFDQARARLRQNLEKLGKSEEFDLLKGFLQGKDGDRYDDIAVQLNTSTANVKMKVNRLRKAYRSLIEEEAQQTLDSEDVLQELRFLLNAL